MGGGFECGVPHFAGSGEPFTCAFQLATDSSNVLNDTIEAGSAPSFQPQAFEREIRFTDSIIESSDVIELFLGFLTHGKLSSGTDSYKKCEVLCHTVRFMRKYDCENLLSFLKVTLKYELRCTRLAPFFHFMLAAAMDDVQWSIAAFQQAYRYNFSGKTDEVNVGREIPGVTDDEMATALLNLRPDSRADGTWPYELWPHISADYLWAAIKAWTKKWAQITATTTAVAAVQQNTQSSEAFADELVSAKKRKQPEPAVEITGSGAPTNYGLYVDLALEYERAIMAVKKLSP